MNKGQGTGCIRETNKRRIQIYDTIRRIGDVRTRDRHWHLPVQGAQREGCYYVDKTDFISAFLTPPGAEVSLITMPEHFGKSLAMSMLADFFDNQKDSAAIFAGLKISKNRALCEKWMNKWPVISLNFKHMGASSFPEALKQISSAVSFAVRQHMYVFQSSVLDEDQINEFAEMEKGTDDNELLESSLELLSIALYLIQKKR